MTQSGQGPEPQYPAVRPTHEGVVLPAEGGVETGQGTGPAGGQPWGGAWGPGGGPQGQQPQQPQGSAQPLLPAQPLPPEAVPGGVADMQATQYIAPIPPAPRGAGPGPMPGPMPGAIPGGQPQPPQGYGYPPPVQPAQPGYGYPPAAQPAQPGYGYPPAPSVADMQATQHIPPVAARGAGSDTQFLGTGPLAGGPPQQPAGASDATQYIAPVPAQTPGERQPPAEFDNLFRSDATQHMPQPPRQAAPPQFQQHQQAPYAPHTPPQQQFQQQPPVPPAFQGAYQDGYDDEPERRRKSPVALIAAVVVGCAVVGLGAGALLSGGGEEKDKGPGQNVAASSGVPSAAPSGKAAADPADPAEPQAKALDKLLADSNNSRDAVIRSVEAIKQCKNLDKAAVDLRGAAGQRRALVTRLQGLSVDKIPDNAALSAALTKAWQASASADDHYAAWADQVKGNKKLCKGGKARGTTQTVEAGKKSSDATIAKREAAGLWNPTAQKFGLPKREPVQL
ncbi:hypothetical protein Q5762_19670 [Streptomyces sp. P9(2023)]|uniref:hypothetical protein n=1 Tax=Streptomyces sp. P9(2023) TaxID=3064394 RepID=UPI0028F42B0F|nr:hypothetical protein [Streptomyces sp. P9(2023)]MDT9690519.1 hypothetical protein [Streptomyces sp. P9(2023)]